MFTETHYGHAALTEYFKAHRSEEPDHVWAGVHLLPEGEVPRDPSELARQEQDPAAQIEAMKRRHGLI